MRAKAEFKGRFNWCLILAVSLFVVCGNLVLPPKEIEAQDTVNKALKPPKQMISPREKFYDASTVNGEAWIVGYYGLILKVKESKGRLVWERQKSFTTSPLFGVSFVDSQNGYVVGKKGLVLKTRDGGRNWESIETGIDKSLFSVFFVNPMEGWAVGEWGTIIYTRDGGKSWENKSIGQDITLYKSLFIDANTGWVVGEFGTIIHTEDGGKSWQIENKGNTSFYNIFFVDQQFGFIVGQNGTIYQTKNRGETWESKKVPTTENLLGINSMGNRVWVVGLRGTFLEGNPNCKFHQAKQLIRVPDWLKAIVFLKSGRGMVFGDHGRILYSDSPGENRGWSILN